jgi:hypothetical protein
MSRESQVEIRITSEAMAGGMNSALQLPDCLCERKPATENGEFQVSRKFHPALLPFRLGFLIDGFPDCLQVAK